MSCLTGSCVLIMFGFGLCFCAAIAEVRRRSKSETRTPPVFGHTKCHFTIFLTLTLLRSFSDQK